MKGYALNKMCLFVQQRRKPRRVQEGRRCVLHEVRFERRAAQSHPRAQRAGVDPCRRMHLLPGEVRRNFRPECSGHRRAADRHDRRSLQARSSRLKENNHGTRSSADSPHRTFLRSAMLFREKRSCSTILTGSRFSPPIRRHARGCDKVKPDVAVVIYNDHGLNFFLDKMPTFAIGAAARVRKRRRGLGHPEDAALPGRSRALLAHHRIARCRRIRHHVVPGDAGGSRVHSADVAVLAGQRMAA